MALSNDAREWWAQTLLGQQVEAHPVFGLGINVRIDGGTVTLSGTVDSPEDAERAEHEVRQLDTVDNVVNKLTVSRQPEKYHMQAVLAVFSDERSARLAQQAIASWTIHEHEPAEVISRRADAETRLKEWADAAHIRLDDLTDVLSALDKEKVLLAERAPEDDALRIISELEGTRAEMIRTLPPEPDSEENR
jgi:hypothetical protein